MAVERPIGNRRNRCIAWSRREREVLDLIASGRTNGEIADALSISFPTAKWHVSELITKLGVSSREEVAGYWRHERSLAGRASRLFSAVAGFGAFKFASGVAAVAIVGTGAGAAVMAFGGESGDANASAVTAPAPTPIPSPISIPTSRNLAERPATCPVTANSKRELLCDYHNWPAIVSEDKGTDGHCDLRDATLPIFLASIDLHGCDLRGANLSMLNDSNLAGTNLAGNSLSTGTFAGVDFTGADLAGVVAKTGVFSGANFTDANLTGADLSGAIVGGAIWSNTTCPDGVNSNAHEGSCVGTTGLMDPPTTYAGG